MFIIDTLFMINYTVLYMQYCCNSTVATVLLQQYCCNGRAPARRAPARRAPARRAAPRRRRPRGGGPSAGARAAGARSGGLGVIRYIQIRKEKLGQDKTR